MKITFKKNVNENNRDEISCYHYVMDCAHFPNRVIDWAYQKGLLSAGYFYWCHIADSIINGLIFHLFYDWANESFDPYINAVIQGIFWQGHRWNSPFWFQWNATSGWFQCNEGAVTYPITFPQHILSLLYSLVFPYICLRLLYLS